MKRKEILTNLTINKSALHLPCVAAMRPVVKVLWPLMFPGRMLFLTPRQQCQELTLDPSLEVWEQSKFTRSRLCPDRQLFFLRTSSPDAVMLLIFLQKCCKILPRILTCPARVTVSLRPSANPHYNGGRSRSAVRAPPPGMVVGAVRCVRRGALWEQVPAD